jgi:hypothetical protein
MHDGSRCRINYDDLASVSRGKLDVEAGIFAKPPGYDYGVMQIGMIDKAPAAIERAHTDHVRNLGYFYARLEREPFDTTNNSCENVRWHKITPTSRSSRSVFMKNRGGNLLAYACRQLC